MKIKPIYLTVMSSRIFRKEARQFAEALHHFYKSLISQQEIQVFKLIVETILLPFLVRWNPNTDKEDFRKAIYTGSVYANPRKEDHE